MPETHTTKRKRTVPVSGAAVGRSTKSRSGCGRCRAKRLKCDEVKPSCQQCARRGVECPGYQMQFVLGLKHADFNGGKLPAAFWPEKANANTVVIGKSTSPSPEASIVSDSADPDVDTMLASSKFIAPQVVPQTAMLDTDFSLDGVMDTDGHPFPFDQLINPTDLRDTAEGDGQMTDQLSAGHSRAFEPAVSQSMLSPRPGIPGAFPFARTSMPSNAVANSIPGRLVDLPSALVEFWFSSICSMWSAYDSDVNTNRLIAWKSWTTSESIYYTLQTMSASYMVGTLPHLKPLLPQLNTKAIAAICSELAALNVNRAECKELPSALLFALCAMGTSTHWVDPLPLNRWYICQARGILDRFTSDTSLLDTDGQNDYAYFHRAMVWWEMLHSAAGNSDTNPKSSTSLASDDMQSTSGPARIPQVAEEVVLHPWTGFSTSVIELFGLTIDLCHKHIRVTSSHDSRSMNSLKTAMANIEVAEKLETKLLSIDFTTSPRHGMDRSGTALSTRDGNTPVSHLLDNAEAYRVACILHLYETFPDLAYATKFRSRSDDFDIDPLSHDLLDRHATISKLALHLTQILKRIPIDSGSKCMQLLLYITAAIGLRFDKLPTTSYLLDGSPSLEKYSNDGLFSTASPDNDAGLSLTTLTLQVAEGRRFVLDRLKTLQTTLPPRPIAVAIQLANSVWDQYDNGRPDTHWITTMSEKGLATLFG